METDGKKQPGQVDIEGEPYVDHQLKAVTQELIKFGILVKVLKPNYYQFCISNSVDINRILVEGCRGIMV